MKTIEESAKAIFPNLETYFGSYDNGDIKQALLFGAEFAQKWILVTEELPGEERVLVKEKDEYLTMARYDIEREEWVSDNDWLVSENVTHWRPIEVK